MILSRCSAVPGNGSVLSSPIGRRVSGLVCGDEIWENRSKCRVRVTKHVLLGPVDNLLGEDVADVTGFPKVIPSMLLASVPGSGRASNTGRGMHTGDDLDKVWHDFENLLPSVIPERFAGTIPLLTPPREVYCALAPPPRKKVLSPKSEGGERTGIEPGADTHHILLSTEVLHV